MDEVAIGTRLAALAADPGPEFTDRILAQLGVDETGGDEYVLVDAPGGEVFVAFNDRGVSHVRPRATLSGDAPAYEAAFVAELGRPLRPAARPPAGLMRALESGSARHLEFDLSGLSDFAAAVLRKTLEIPAGQVRPYGWIAGELGKPGATRAVGTALNRNPVPVLIPCHRVVRSDGSVGEYAYGTRLKLQLLESEGVPLVELEGLAASGVRYLGSDTTKIYCFPTCHHARRVTPRHEVTFGNEREAAEAGYRPCKTCRPARAS